MSDHPLFSDSGLAGSGSPSDLKREDARLGKSSTAANKRKREASDHEGLQVGGHTRRSAHRRVSPNRIADDDDTQNSAAASMDFHALTHNNGNDPSGQQNGGMGHGDAPSTAAAALGMFPTMTVPQPTDLSFASSASGAEGDRNLDPSFGMDSSGMHGDSDSQNFNLDALRDVGPGSHSKPAVGSEEWHRIRRDNHKEVERRRRETINEGINELAKIVPNCEKNKGSILQRAVSFITQLKENEAQNIEKWTLEKLLTEQAIAELSATNDKLKNEVARAWKESESWKRTAEKAGLSRVDDGDGQDEADEAE